ncbi:MAG TPA: PH domain-containing protein [Galbitalea sp.]|nr:PH domain-containing protein [Galbitalea sp.]
MSEPAPAERVVARLRPHGRALFWPTAALLASVGGAAYFFGRFSEQWENLAVLGIAALLILLLWVVPLVLWLGRNYTITTRRIILRSGFVVRIRQELLHSRGYDVTVRKTGLQSAFGSGDVQINTGLEHPVVLRDVPTADLVQAALHDLMEANQNLVASRRQEESAKPPDETTIWGTR